MTDRCPRGATEEAAAGGKRSPLEQTARHTLSAGDGTWEIDGG